MPQQGDAAVDSARAQRSCARAAASQDDGEYFDLDNVSGSDNPEDDNSPVNHRGRGPQAQAVNTSQDINNPEPTRSKNAAKNAANDVWYFFEKGEQCICRECRYVSPSHCFAIVD